MKIQRKLTIYNLTSIFIDTSILTKFYGHIKMFFSKVGKKAQQNDSDTCALTHVCSHIYLASHDLVLFSLSLRYISFNNGFHFHISKISTQIFSIFKIYKPLIITQIWEYLYKPIPYENSRKVKRSLYVCTRKLNINFQHKF